MKLPSAYRLYCRLEKESRPPLAHPRLGSADRVLLVRSMSLELMKLFLSRLPRGIPVGIVDRHENEAQVRRIVPQARFFAYEGQANFCAEGLAQLRGAIAAFAPTRAFFLSGNPTAAGYDNIVEGLAALGFEPQCFTLRGQFLRFPAAWREKKKLAVARTSALLQESWEELARPPQIRHAAPRKPRIALDLRVLNTPQMTGVGRFAYEISRAIARRSRAFGFGAGERFAPPGVKNLPHSIPEGDPALAERHLSFLARASGADLYFSPYSPVPSHGSCPRFLTVHDLIPLKFPEWAPSTRTIELFKTTLRENVRVADHVFAVSDHTRRDLMKLYGVPARRITVLPNALDHRHFRPRAHAETSPVLRSLAAALGLRPGYLLSLCTLEPRKNIPTVLKIFQRYCERNPSSTRQLLLVGKRGWAGNSLEQAIAAHPQRDRIIVSGYLDDRGLPQVYSAAFAFLFPSYYEGFGLPPLEALACGTAVLSSNASSLPEACGDAALYAGPDDVETFAAHLDALAEPALRETLRAKGLAQAAKFSWDKSAEIFFETIRKFI